MKRDLYIDYAKGLATLSIIFIHTAFWSGQFYIKTEFRVLSLLFDVPLFYALSGLTSGGNIEKTFYRLLKLQITYMIFVTVLFFADYFFKVFGLYFFTAFTVLPTKTSMIACSKLAQKSSFVACFLEKEKI